MSLKRVMTAIRLEDGKVAVHSAIAMEPKAQAELEAWGELAYLIVPNPGHRLEAPAAMDPVTSGTANGWQMSGGAFEQTVNRTDSMLIANYQLRFGCLTTLVNTADNDESGIVFNYKNSQDFFAFDVTPSVRRRVQNGVSTDLSNIPINVQASWSPGIKLMVCFTDGSIHTFIGHRGSFTDYRNRFIDRASFSRRADAARLGHSARTRDKGTVPSHSTGTG